MALAQALGASTREFVIALDAPWSWMAPRMRWPWPYALPGVLRDELNKPPALVIGCGRTAAFATAMLRTHVPDCKAIQILDPRIPLRHFDRVIAPAHDALVGGNVITTLGALNPVATPWLNDAAQAHATLRATAAPRLAVLVGGPHRDWAFGLDALERMLQSAADWQSRRHGSVWLTTSRRTPQAFEARIVEFAGAAAQRIAFVDSRATLFKGALPTLDAANPYSGFLALSDALWVSADSVNLASEACATGKPVFVFEPERAHGKLSRFHSALAARGHARNGARLLVADVNATWPPALREAAAVAHSIRTTMIAGNHS